MRNRSRSLEPAGIWTIQHVRDMNLMTRSHLTFGQVAKLPFRSSSEHARDQVQNSQLVTLGTCTTLNGDARFHGSRTDICECAAAQSDEKRHILTRRNAHLRRSL